jgi:hypothetical protein
LALARMKQGQPSDFGLAPWGTMDVDVWYSRWRRFPESGLNLPAQLDVWRAGRPYKRMTTISLVVNPPIPSDSLTMPDSLRTRFLAGGRKPMFDLPLDSAKVIDGSFASFAANGTPAGAVRLGGRWVMIEAGTAPLTIERSAAFLEKAGGEAKLGGALLTAPSGGGGVAWLVDRSIPTWIAPANRAYTEAALRGWGRKSAGLTALPPSGWVRVGTDSLRVETIDLPYVADAEIVLEAEILPTGWTQPEGRFGEFTGLMGGLHWNPNVRVKAVLMRSDPVYYALHMPWENTWLAAPTRYAQIRQALKTAGVVVKDINVTLGGCAFWHAVISIKKQAGEAKNAMLAALSVMDLKHVVIVDDDIDVRDWKEVIWAITTRVDAKRDTLIAENTPIDYLDFASPVSGLGSKMGIDATSKWPGETQREWGRPIAMDPEVKQRVDALWADLGL